MNSLKGGVTAALFILLAVSAAKAAAAQRPFHVRLESNAAASFPLLRRFGTSTIDLFPAGFRVKTIWLRGFSRNGSRTFTVENPVSRTYVVMPMSEVGGIVHALGGQPIDAVPPGRIQVMNGTVRGLPARRFRLLYGGDEFIDVWTTSALGATPEYRAFVIEIVRAISPPSAAVVKGIPGTPLYVEANVGKHRKVVVLRPRSVAYNRDGESDALRIGQFMFPAPFGTIFK